MRDLLLLIVFLSLFVVPATVAFVRAKQELRSQQTISMGTFGAAMFAYTALAAGVVLGSWLNAWPSPIVPWVIRAVGVILVLVDAIVYSTARLTMRSFRQTWGLQADTLLTTGIYGLVRHPQNVGWGLLLAGIAMLGNSGLGLALTGLYILASILWLPVEEAALEHRFGSLYIRYRATTPAVVPFIRPRQSQQLQ